MRACLGLLAVVVSVGCQTYQDDLTRAQRAFEQNQHEHALAILRQLEPDTARLAMPEQAQYAYVRGMTDYRIGYKAEARHWLSLAAAIEQATPDALPEEWTKRLNDSLKELNEEVFTAGIESLSNAAASKGKASDDDSTGSDSDAGADPGSAKPKPKPKSDDE